ncbi:hypothetical protein B0G84_8616 [Paraburkholderia sp. BL8N3]|nr:hypothetical protein [Paraburkholderia sp. BL8N3]TCK32745.1 hypothetical protein B0G84_8616 [Paraburkholderia sp. BL8N3]
MAIPQSKARGLVKERAHPTKAWPKVLGFSVAVLPAVATYVASFVDKVRVSELEFVDAQIEKLYGPLYALTQTDRFSYETFVRAHAPGGEAFTLATNYPPTAEQMRLWRTWVTTVFQPLNLKMEDAIVSNAHLVIGAQLPAAFIGLIAETEKYKVLIELWKAQGHDKDLDVTYPGNVVGIPGGLTACAAQSYLMLKARQKELRWNLLSVLWARPLSPPESCVRAEGNLPGK